MFFYAWISHESWFCVYICCRNNNSVLKLFSPIFIAKLHSQVNLNSLVDEHQENRTISSISHWASWMAPHHLLLIYFSTTFSIWINFFYTPLVTHLTHHASPPRTGIGRTGAFKPEFGQSDPVSRVCCCFLRGFQWTSFKLMTWMVFWCGLLWLPGEGH